MNYRNTMCFAPAGIDACALWRMWMPHLNIKGSRFIYSQGMPDLNLISECDIIVVQRLMTKENIHFLQIARSHGIRIIYDLDDNLWDLPQTNPGKSFFDSPDVVRGLDACAEWADIITVSTKRLKRVVEDKWGYIKNVATHKQLQVRKIDNCVDTNLFTKPVLPRDPDKIVIGWGGSNTHAGDVQKLWQILPEVLKDFDNVYLEFVGEEPPINIVGHPRVRVRPWCDVSEFHNRFATWNWDIVLAPLQEHSFNKSKSSIKMLEAGCISAPCLAQDIAPYEYFTSFNRELNWLLCQNFEWKKKLYRLIEDTEYRKKLGDLMYQNTVQNFSIERAVQEWENIAQSM